MTITNYVNLSTILVYSWKHFSFGWSFVEYSRHQQCLQIVECPTMLVNSVKHISIKGPFSKYFWHLRFFSWHIIKTLTTVQLFWWHHQHTYGWQNVLEDGWNVVLFATISSNYVKQLVGNFNFNIYLKLW